MKTGRDISQLADEIIRQRGSARDFIAPTSQLSLSTGFSGSSAIEVELPDGPQLFPMSRHAHGQIAGRLDIPKRFYDDLGEQHPKVRDRLVNELWQERDEKRLLRTLDGQARAFLSDRFRPIDNFMIAEAVLPILGGRDDMKIQSAEVTDRRLYIKATFSSITRQISVGDVLHSGISIRNSEVGCGAFDVSLLVYRLVCENGMIGESTLRRNHVGSRIGNGEDAAAEFFSNETRRADDRALSLKIQDVTRAAINDDSFNSTVDRILAARDEKIEGDLPKVVEDVSKRFSFNSSEQSGVLRHLIEGGDLSRWGMVNAVTRASQDVSDYDRATDLERDGGKILELLARSWADIVNGNNN